MTKSKIALAMIVRGNEDPNKIMQCLNSIARFVDGVYITITTPDEGVKAAAERYGVVIDLEPFTFHREVRKEEIDWIEKNIGIKSRLKVGDKIFQFDKARNHNFAQVPQTFQWILWLDVDDVFRGGDKIKDLIETAETYRPEPAESVFLNYIYQAEIVNGQVKDIVIQHLRERIVRNNGVYEWVAPIHETLIEKRPTVKIQDSRCDILHLSHLERMQEAIQRNIKTLELSVHDKQLKDPRPTYYLGKAFFDLRTPDDLTNAERLFYIYLNGTPEENFNNKSGWAEERAQCWEYLSEIYRIRGEHNNSIKALHNCLIEDEKFPSVYLNLAYSHLLKNEYDRAIFWAKLSAHVPEPQTTLVTNPRDNKARFLEVMYHANLYTNRLDEAWAAAQKMGEIFPDQEVTKQRIDLTNSLKRQREMTQAIMNLANHLRATGESHKLKPLLVATPAEIADNPFMVNLSKQIYPPRIWMENEIAIFCGMGFTPWTPKSLTDPGANFVGGSEEACIRVGQELSKKGWKVTVYGDPGADEGEYDGVKYLPYFKFNAQDQFNILIGWRNPKFVDGNYQARRIYIWCHDIVNNLDYTPERVAKIHKVIFLSRWQRSGAPNVPEEKCFYSNNGFD